ncbi:hypothetical protein ACP70R_009247 [Stipagrostis hirtigluma subsp. patula]
MVSSLRLRRLQKQQARAAARRASRLRRAEQLVPDLDVRVLVDRLPAELLADIHRGLPFLQRLAFASICGVAGRLLKPEAPWLVLPGDVEGKATLFSLADREAATVRTSGPAMRGHVVVGSSGGWLVTADARGALRMANPVTGAQADLPAMATIPMFLRSDYCFCLDAQAFVQLRFGGPPPPDDKVWGPIPPRTYSLSAMQMRQWFFRKVVLDAHPSPGSYAAMLISQLPFGVPAFATAEDPNWRLAPSYDGIEDAIHHDGRFYSISYSGVVEAWDRNAETGEFTSSVVAPRLPLPDDEKHHRKYLAAAPDGRLMAVLKGTKEEDHRFYWSRKVTRPFFKVRILDMARQRWDDAVDHIGDAALFVGMNASLCVPAREYWGIRPGGVYFTDDELGEASVRHEEGGHYICNCDEDNDYRDNRYKVNVYSLRKGMAECIYKLEKHPCWPRAAWFTPSFS